MGRSLRRQLAATAPVQWWHARQDLRRITNWDPIDDRRVEFYRSFLRAGDLAFDIGANIGNRTKIFRRLGARVIALEPQPYCQSILKRAFASDDQVVILEAAAGSADGAAEMKIASGHVVSSLSAEWIGAVNESGRFKTVTWDKTITCKVTSLDQLIATYGIPAFVKVDVEGYEREVIEGLGSRVAALSFEYTPECRSSAFECIDRLDSLGMSQFRYSATESLEFDGPWRGKEQIRETLEAITDCQSYGDVYARTPGA